MQMRLCTQRKRPYRATAKGSMTANSSSIDRIEETAYTGLLPNTRTNSTIAKCFDRAKCFDSPAHAGSPIRGISRRSRALDYQNPSVIRRIAQECRVNNEAAEAIFGETKTFLWESAQGRKPTNPTKLVDEGWHAFILHTKDYADYCTQYLGRFIHHVPE